MNLEISSVLLVSRNIGVQEIEHRLVIDFNIRNANSNCLIEFRSNLVVNLSNSSWDDSPVFIVVLRTAHGEGLARAGLTVTEDCSVVSLYNA